MGPIAWPYVGGIADILGDMDLIGSTEAAELAGVTPSTFRTLVAKGKAAKDPVPAPAVTLPRQTLWKRKDIERWAASRDRVRGRAKRKDADA